MSKRWNYRKKAGVCMQIRDHGKTEEQILKEYPGLGADELKSWLYHYDTYGPLSLRNASIQHFRQTKTAFPKQG